MAEFTGMVNKKKAKSLQETRGLMRKLKEKQKRVEEVRGGTELDRAHVASVLLGMIDQETLKHISQSPETLMTLSLFWCPLGPASLYMV